MYKFRKSTIEEKQQAVSYGMSGDWIYESGKAGNEEYALFFGKVRTVFGEPDYISEDWENMYGYMITAEDCEDNNKLFFEIYHGSCGSSVAMPRSKDVDSNAYEKAKKQLVELIESAEPVDYEWEGVYEDIPVNIKYIVRNGKVKVESEFPEF
ncbi:MAG: hypothetical protein K2G63_03160 [Oscillospiraceae bacterium]|nr:hypothetical protein [Oscillospiraceae bacterium]